jgi:hypothetical protein
MLQILPMLLKFSTQYTSKNFRLDMSNANAIFRLEQGHGCVKRERTDRSID